MILRCQTETPTGRCKLVEGHRSECNGQLARDWCSVCRGARPAQGHARCGDCGGAHADDARHRPPAWDRKLARREGLRQRRDRIAARVEVLREAGVLA